MPVISFSISESLRKFLSKLVTGNYYKNNSYVVRDALTRLMNSYSDVDTDLVPLTDEFSETKESLLPIVGNIMIIVDKYDEAVERKISRLEISYKDSIKAKNCLNYNNSKTIVYVCEDQVKNFQQLVTELNQIEELKNIRYIIL